MQVLGWDEAFVGVETDDPEAYARMLQQAVLDRTSLHCSVGIGDTLVRAKVATGFGKPRGVYRLTADNWLDVMGDRPTIDLWGVGTKISRRLAALGVTTVRELAAADLAALMSEFGPRMGPWYILLGRGEGATVVDDTPWVARGHSRETTYQQDLTEPAQVEEAMRELTERVLEDITAEGRPVIGLTLKVRYAPFMTKVFTKKVAETFDREVVWDRVLELVARIEPDRPIRLLGLRAEMPMPEDAREGTRRPAAAGEDGEPVWLRRDRQALSGSGAGSGASSYAGSGSSTRPLVEFAASASCSSHSRLSNGRRLPE